jgi:hypothetical protein
MKSMRGRMIRRAILHAGKWWEKEQRAEGLPGLTTEQSAVGGSSATL